MAASYPQFTAVETDRAVCQDTFPEVAYFEVPSELSSKTVSSKTRDLVKHPAFREISAINGEINRMPLKSLKVELDALGLDSRGTKDVLRKRLKAYERRRVLTAAGIEDPNTPRQHYTHLLVIDFEATCEEHQTKNYVHEIIEFPAVLVRVEDVAVVAEFHSLVRPVLNPSLSPFCSQLTGIPQDSVDSAPPFPEVLSQFEQWLTEQGVTDDGRSKLAVATDGPWDMARFLLMQCNVSKLPFPTWARSWINLRKIFSNFYVTKRLCLSEMLSALGLEFRGRPHCGLDDARNIAAIAEVLVRDGAAPRVNETIAHLPRSAPPSLKGSSVSSVTLKEFETSERRRLRASSRNTRAAAAARSDGGANTSNTLACAAGGELGHHTVDGVCGGVGHLELSGESLSSKGYSDVVTHINGNYAEGGTEAVMCNGYSTSGAAVQHCEGHTNGYVEAILPGGEDNRRYQDDESCESFLPGSTKETSSYGRNCYSISSSRTADSPSQQSSPPFSSNIINSSDSSPHPAHNLRHAQDKMPNPDGNDSWSHYNGYTETTSVSLQNSSSSSMQDTRNPVPNCTSAHPAAITSECSAVPPPTAVHPSCNTAGEVSNHQDKSEYSNSIPYFNIEYPSSGVGSSASSASPRSVSRQSSYSVSDHQSTNSHPQDVGSHQTFAETSSNRNASGLRRPNNRRRNNNNNNQPNPAGTNSVGSERRPPQHHPVNKGNARYPHRSFEDSSTNSFSRGKPNRKSSSKPGNPRMGGCVEGRGGSLTSFFSQSSAPVNNSSATISMDLSDTNEFPVLGSMKRCPR